MKTAIKPFYQRKEISKDEYKEIVRKAVEKVNASSAHLSRALIFGSPGSSRRARLDGYTLRVQQGSVQSGSV